MVTHGPVILALRRQKSRCRFQASLIYAVNSRLVRAHSKTLTQNIEKETLIFWFSIRSLPSNWSAVASRRPVSAVCPHLCRYNRCVSSNYSPPSFPQFLLVSHCDTPGMLTQITDCT